MDLAEPRLGGVGGGGEGGAIGDVELERQHAFAQESARLVEMVLADVGDDDIHAGALQRPGDAEADAARAAGDERGLAFKILQRTLSSIADILYVLLTMRF